MVSGGRPVTFSGIAPEERRAKAHVLRNIALCVEREPALLEGEADRAPYVAAMLRAAAEAMWP